ncbi:MAG: hypothetical protein ACMUJM_24505 [bacterium]
MYKIWDAYMDNPYCLIAEFIYKADSYSNGVTVTVSPQTASVADPLYGRNVGANVNSPGAGAAILILKN